jgi:hypothetical protein
MADVADIARTHGVKEETAQALLDALRRGGGGQAQFDIAELGGLGQWSRGGMTQVGDMFNDALKGRVDALARDLAPLAGKGGEGQGEAGQGSGDWWPEGLGRPSATGGQGDLRYAVFPESRRLALSRGGRVSLHDTGGRIISGVQQSGGSDPEFSGPDGPVRLSDLPEV